MPNRHTTDNNYRYAFQGQEKDDETGMEAFELRLWDGRIGRWLTTDPYHEFFSPSLGMGNNPISLIDPDGGSTIPTGAFEKLGDLLNFIKAGQMGSLPEAATAHIGSISTNVPAELQRAIKKLGFSESEFRELVIHLREMEQNGRDDPSREFATSRFTFLVSDGSKHSVYNDVAGPDYISSGTAAHVNPASGIDRHINEFNRGNETRIQGGEGHVKFVVVSHTHNVIFPGVQFEGKPSRSDKSYHATKNVGLSIVINTRDNIVYYAETGSKKFHKIKNANGIFD
jgi:RHS repeat-associated protein